MGKAGRYIWLILGLFLAVGFKNTALAQGSIFGKGAWGRVGITTRGVYKIDVAALNSMGLLPAGALLQRIKLDFLEVEVLCYRRRWVQKG